jgi:hypothetical protein
MSQEGKQAMTGDTEQAFFQHQGIGWLWFGILAGPLAFLLNLQLSYMLVQPVCVTAHHLVLHLVPVGALLLTVSGGVSAWRNWRRTGQAESSEAGGVLPRSRFLAGVGLLTSGLFIVVIVAQWLPNFILALCQH